MKWWGTDHYKYKVIECKPILDRSESSSSLVDIPSIGIIENDVVIPGVDKLTPRLDSSHSTMGVSALPVSGNEVIVKLEEDQ